MSPRTVGLFAFVWAITLAGSSAAEGGVKPSAALLAGYGSSLDGENVLGPGLGVRAGLGFGPGVYLGALLLLHSGSTDPLEPDVRHHAQSLRAELGYGFDFSGVELRPSLRVGAAWVTTARDVDGGFTSPDLGLGFTLLLPLDRVRLGVDAETRYFARLVNNWDYLYPITTAALYATIGYQF